MLLVAPDPDLGIAPERVSRLRGLVEDLPTTAPGVAIAIPGGPDGVLDALVLRPDRVLGLVPAGPGSRRGPDDDPGRRARAEIDRLLGLADPTPAGPREVLPIVDPRASGRARPDDPERTDEDTAVGTATAARLALSAGVGPAVLGAAEVRRLCAAWRLAEFTPAPSDLIDAGFTTTAAAGSVPDDGVDGVVPGTPVPALVPSARASSSQPGGAPVPAGVGPRSAAPAVFTGGASPAAPMAAGPTSAGVVTAAVAGGSLPGGGGSLPGGGGSLSGGGGSLPGGAEHPSRPPTTPLAMGRGADDDRSPARAGRRTGGSGRRSGGTGGHEPVGYPQEPGGDGRRGGSGRRGPLRWLGTWRRLALAALAVFAVTLVVAVLVVRAFAPAAEDTVAAAPVRVVDGVTWTQRSAATDPTCEGHSYGLVVQFLAERPCVALDRTLWTARADDTDVVASLAAVRMRDAASAAALKSLIDSSGTGNISDLLREGRGYPGGPPSLGDGGYASIQLGDTVVIAETDATDGSSPKESTLDTVARQSLGLRPS